MAQICSCSANVDLKASDWNGEIHLLRGAVEDRIRSHSSPKEKVFLFGLISRAGIKQDHNGQCPSPLCFLSRKSWNIINIWNVHSQTWIDKRKFGKFSHTGRYFPTNLTCWKTTVINQERTFLFSEVTKALWLSNGPPRKRHKFTWRPQCQLSSHTLQLHRLGAVGFCLHGRHLVPLICRDVWWERISTRLTLV